MGSGLGGLQGPSSSEGPGRATLGRSHSWSPSSSGGVASDSPRPPALPAVFPRLFLAFSHRKAGGRSSSLSFPSLQHRGRALPGASHPGSQQLGWAQRAVAGGWGARGAGAQFQLSEDTCPFRPRGPLLSPIPMSCSHLQNSPHPGGSTPSTRRVSLLPPSAYVSVSPATHSRVAYLPPPRGITCVWHTTGGCDISPLTLLGTSVNQVLAEPRLSTRPHAAPSSPQETQGLDITSERSPSPGPGRGLSVPPEEEKRAAPS